MGDAVRAADAAVRLPHLVQTPVQTHEIGSAGLSVGLHLIGEAFSALVRRLCCNVALVDTLVVVAEVSRDVYAVRARHAVLAPGAMHERVAA